MIQEVTSTVWLVANVLELTAWLVAKASVEATADGSGLELLGQGSWFEELVGLGEGPGREG